MDFLPVDNSSNARLQYTESYVLPTNANTDFTTNQHHDFHAPSHIQADSHETNYNSSQAQPAINIHPQSSAKVRDDIDSYIRRKSNKDIEEPPKQTFNQSLVQIHSVFQPSKPAMLESHAESISNKHLEGKIQQSSIVPQHSSNEPQINILDEIDSINCNQVSESRRQSKPSPHFRHLQQSSVNIVIDHDLKKKEVEQVIPSIGNASESLKSHSVNQHTRNLQKYEVNNPILQRSDQRCNVIDEDIIPAQPHPDSFDIPSIQPSSAQYLNDSKQFLRRNLNASQVEESNIVINQIQPHEDVLKELILTDKEIAETPIFISPSQEQDSLSTNKKNMLKRSIQQRKLEEPLSFSINSYHTEHIQQTRKYPLERSLLLEKTEPAIALHIHDSLEESINGSPKHSQKRKLQPSKLAESVPLHLEPDLQHSLISSPKQSLKRSLEAKRLGQSVQIHLEDDKSQHLPDKSESIFLKRSIEQRAAQGSLILPPDINDPVQEHVVETNPQHLENDPHVLERLDQSIHLSERLETMPSPKNILPLKRDLKFNHVLHPQQQPVVLNEVSHQAVESQNNHILEEPRVQLQPQPILIDYVLEEQTFKAAKKANPFTRNLKPSLKPTLISSQSLTLQSDQGWNPSKKTFHVFKLPDLDSHSEHISFTKSRISTASTHH